MHYGSSNILFEGTAVSLMLHVIPKQKLKELERKDAYIMDYYHGNI